MNLVSSGIVAAVDSARFRHYDYYQEYCCHGIDQVILKIL